MKITPSFRLFWAIAPTSIKWIVLGCFAGLVLALGNRFMLPQDPRNYSILNYLPEFLFVAVGILIVLATYLEFRLRVDRFPFPIGNWENLSSESDFLDGKTWRHLRIEIVVVPGETEYIRKANKALQTMVEKSKRNSYAAQRGSAKRHDWTITDGPLIAYGSADRGFWFDFYLLCIRLQKANVPVERILLAQQGKSFKVDAESDTMS